jgi:hypothetical protein
MLLARQRLIYYRRRVLITQTKVINLHGQPVKVFSIDGKLWVSKPSDLKEFKSRRTHEKAICQKYFAERTMFLLPVSSFDADYWPR